MKYFVDSNIFLRAFLADNKEQFKKSVKFLERIKNNEIEAVTATVVIAEVVWTMLSYYHATKKEVSDAADSILSSGISIINLYDHSYALELFRDKNVKFIDALIASIYEIKEKKMMVISFDHDFDKLGVLRKEPGSVLAAK